MPGLKFEVQLSVCVVVCVLIFMPGCLTQGTDSCNDYNNTAACCKANCAFVSCMGADNKTQVSKCINETTVSTVCLNFTDDGVNNCTKAPETCADFSSNKTECCNSPLSCAYVTNCTTDDSVSDVCLPDDDTAISKACPKDQGQKICFAPVGSCTNFTSETECCASPLNCTFVANCTTDKDEEIQVCVLDDDEEIKKTCPKDQGTKTCAKDQTTTTEKPTTTSTAPTKVKCNTLNASACCGATGKDLSCDYVNCTGTVACLNATEIAKCNATGDSMCDMHISTTTISTTTTTKASGRGSDCSKQHFDGASFIGGIILCGGIIAIIFFGLKFYRSRQDSNYHTL